MTTKKRNIKFTVIAKRWFDKVNGNTYHSVRVIRMKDGAVITTSTPFHYGYGDHYRQTALELMSEKKWLPVKYRLNKNATGKSSEMHPCYSYERELNYPILWDVTDGLKRDMVNNGIL